MKNSARGLVISMAFGLTMILSCNALAVDPNWGSGFTRGLRIRSESDDTTWDDSQGNFHYFRFAGTSFVGAGHDFSGVGIVDDPDPLKDMGTMISASFCLGSSHSCRYPQPNQWLRLYKNKTTSSTYQVDNTIKLGNSAHTSCLPDPAGSDLEVCKLKSKIGSDFAVYPVFSRPELESGGLTAFVVGKPRSATYSGDYRVAKRQTKAQNWISYIRPYEQVFRTWQEQHNSYGIGDPLQPIQVTAPYAYPYLTNSGAGTLRLEAGRNYLLTAKPNGSGTAIIYWMASASVPIGTSTKSFSGPFELRATAPAGTAGVYVQFTGSASIDRVSFRDVTLTTGYSSGSDHADIYNGDSGSPTLGYGVSGTLDSPTQTGASPNSWGLVVFGVHRSPVIDNSITNSSEAANLRTHMADMQSGVAEHLKEQPVFWSGVYGDFNGDMNLDASDIDILVRKVKHRSANGYNWYLDWDKDGVHHYDDVIAYVEDEKTFHTKVGDCDLDGDVMNDDAVNFGTWNSDNCWANGDLNGDGVVTPADFSLGIVNINWVRP